MSSEASSQDSTDGKLKYELLNWEDSLDIFYFNNLGDCTTRQAFVAQAEQYGLSFNVLKTRAIVECQGEYHSAKATKLDKPHQ